MGDAELLSWINTGKNIAALLVAVGVAGEFAGDWISGPINRRIDAARQEEITRLTASSDTQRRELAEAVARGKEAEARISEADARAKSAEAQVAAAMAASDDAVARVKTADARIAEAQRGAAEASTKAEGFRLDIARANQTAEQERLARLQLEARLADRVLTPEQQRKLTGALTPFKGKTIDVSVFGDTLEIVNFSGALLNCFRQAGLLVNTSNPIGGGTSARGVLIGIKPGSPPEIARIADVLVSVLQESVGPGAGRWDFDKLVSTGAMAAVSQATGAEKVGEAPIRIFIGSK
jgi:hypothetical protein